MYFIFNLKHRNLMWEKIIFVAHFPSEVFKINYTYNSKF